MTCLVKICGVTRPGDAAVAVDAGADWLGLNFWPGSKRCIDTGAARRVVEAARAAAASRAAAVSLVGVFVDQPGEDIARAVADLGLDRAQLHGRETPEQCAALVAAGVPVVKAVALSSMDDVARLRAYDVDYLLVDTPTPGRGGSGRTFDWALARAAVATGARVVLAGGLGPDNVARAVAEVGPCGVDVASGVESAPGVKEPDRVRAFVSAAKGASHGQ